MGIIDIDKEFKGVFIPEEIWNTKMPLNDKLYLSIYKQTEDFKTTDELMSYNISNSSIAKIKNRLAQKGLIKYITSPEQAKQEVLNLLDNGNVCEWCRRKTYVLHEHHFPTPKSKGGTKTVKICPNCHANYHYIFKG